MQIKLFAIKAIIITCSAFDQKKSNKQQEFIPLLYCAEILAGDD